MVILSNFHKKLTSGSEASLIPVAHAINILQACINKSIKQAYF